MTWECTELLSTYEEWGTFYQQNMVEMWEAEKIGWNTVPAVSRIVKWKIFDFKQIFSQKIFIYQSRGRKSFEYLILQFLTNPLLWKYSLPSTEIEDLRRHMILNETDLDHLENQPGVKIFKLVRGSHCHRLTSGFDRKQRGWRWLPGSDLSSLASASTSGPGSCSNTESTLQCSRLELRAGGRRGVF